MPATESTWYNMTVMHRIFAVTAVVLTLCTIWMFYKDHYRPWKVIQTKNVEIDVAMNRYRTEQFETDQVRAEHARLSIAASEARALPIDPAQISAFEAELKTEDKTLPNQQAYLVELQKKSADAKTARAEAVKARAAADAKLADHELQLAATAAEKSASDKEAEAAGIRAGIVKRLQGYVNQAQIHETKTLGDRKFKSAYLDKAKADLDIGVRDSLDEAAMKKLQDKVNDEKKDLDKLTALYQRLSKHRIALQDILATINAPVAAAEKSLADSEAAKKRLETTVNEKKESYFVSSGIPFLPLPGKKILNLPILDAFGSRRKPENLWSSDLEQNYSHRVVRRFDRCTTCHGSMQKSLPGDPNAPLYADETSFQVVITPRTAAEIQAARAAAKQPEVDAAGQPIPFTLEEYLGLKLADHGLLSLDDVVVKYVEPRSPGAAAQPIDSTASPKWPTGAEIQLQAATGITPAAASPVPTRTGLLVGDVIESIDGSDLSGQFRGAARAAISLVDLAADGKPFKVGVLRGLPHPYNSHPRLDLFLSDSSPHKLSTFACTICHEGQGSATDFKWASHTPNDQTQLKEWAGEHGWFNNHHWIYPMYPARFTEATCLKCHHDVVELEPSQKFPDPPAEKLMHGYHLIRKYGCYGCHEVNGYDGPTKRVGPDLRLEPNFFAVAQQFEFEAGKVQGEKSPALTEMLDLAHTLAANPDDDATRRRLMAMIDEDQTAETKVLPAATYKLAGMLRDVEAPGSLRKPGPSLRFVGHKVDVAFLYDWIWNPQHFRPSTRMPRFLGLWDHLEDAASLKAAHDLEPIEARGLTEFLLDRTQNFEPEQRPSGVDEWTDEQMITRGKRMFETRGCLACHTHKDFPDTTKFRAKDEIVQGPDLSNLGAKFSNQVNPQGPMWLYSWIKNPTRYHARTVMPNLYLTPDKDKDGKVYDPAEDITTFLLADNDGKWKPILSKEELTKDVLDAEVAKALKALTTEYMNEAFFKDDVERAGGYYETGLPESMRADLKGAETELITANNKLNDKQRLRYIGLKTVSKYGCYGCHDIPGFEDAKPIGTQLQNWGRKDPSRLAFEHIGHYPKSVGYKHEGGAHGAHGDAHAKKAPAKAEADPSAERAGGGDGAATGSDHPEHDGDDHAKREELPVGFEDYYGAELGSGSRIGFIYQKLQEPRSYDYQKTANKRFNERLRMPQFPFTAQDREAVTTFVLGLVAEPPREKYLYRANPRAKAIAEGKIVLEKFNCGGCHILEADKWKLSFTPGAFEAQTITDPVYPFLLAHFSPAEVAKSATPDSSNRLHAQILGIPKMTKQQGLPELVDLDDGELSPDDPYDPRNTKLSVDTVQPALIAGNVHLAGLSKISVPGSTVSQAYTGHGGMLTRYLVPRVTAISQETNANASGAEAYGWLPPPLFGEGEKVQSNWLFEFLLDPYPIRPAVYLRMPKFNMSRDEATKLVNYFAAVDNAAYPYEAASMRKDSHLADKQAKYAEGRNRLDDAMKIVLDRKNFCAQCHKIADFDPGGNPQAKGPNLADVYRRLRPDYVRDWIANPKMILPYTGMPINIPYNPDREQQGKATHYQGNSEEQVQALVDLLMNYDAYAKGKNPITPQIPAPEPVPAEGTPAPGTAK